MEKEDVRSSTFPIRFSLLSPETEKIIKEFFILNLKNNFYRVFYMTLKR